MGFPIQQQDDTHGTSLGAAGGLSIDSAPQSADHQIPSTSNSSLDWRLDQKGESFFARRDPNMLRWELLLVGLLMASGVLVGEGATGTALFTDSSISPVVLLLGLVTIWGVVSTALRLRSVVKFSISHPVIISSVLGAFVLVCATLLVGGLDLSALFTVAVTSASTSIFSAALFVAAREFSSARNWEPLVDLKVAWIKESVNSPETSCPINALRPGMLAYSRSADPVVGDGVIVSGVAVVEEIRLGGAAHVRIRGEGETIYAGSRIIKGEITYRIEGGVPEVSGVSARLNPTDSPTTPENLKSWSRLTGIIGWSAIFLSACVTLLWREINGDLATAIAIGAATVATLSIVWNFEIRHMLPALKLRELFKVDVLASSCSVLDGLRSKSEVLVELPTGDKFAGYELSGIELIDPSLDRMKINSVLLSMLGRSSEDLAQAWVESLNLSSADLLPIKLEGFYDYQGLGLIAVVQGVEFSFGTEEFILARGCRVEPSDILIENDGSQALYLALGEDIVLRCILSAPKVATIASRLARTTFITPNVDVPTSVLASRLGVEDRQIRIGIPNLLTPSIFSDKQSVSKGRGYILVSPLAGSAFRIEANQGSFLTVGFPNDGSLSQPLPNLFTYKGRLKSLILGIERLSRFARIENFAGSVIFALGAVQILLTVVGILPAWAVLLTNSLTILLLTLTVLPPERPFGKLAIYSPGVPRN